MPSRVLRADFNSSESMAAVSIGARLTFAKLVLAVDDYGRLDARPAMLKSALFPVERDVTEDDAYAFVCELCQGDDPPVALYEVEGRTFLYLTKWEKHRGKSQRGSKSKFPAPSEGEPKPTPEARGNCESPPVSRESGVGSRVSCVVSGARADAPPPESVVGFVSMLPKGKPPDEYVSWRAWFDDNCERMIAEACLKGRCDELGEQFNRAFRTVLMAWTKQATKQRGRASASPRPTVDLDAQLEAIIGGKA